MVNLISFVGFEFPLFRCMKLQKPQVQEISHVTDVCMCISGERFLPGKLHALSAGAANPFGQ